MILLQIQHEINSLHNLRSRRLQVVAARNNGRTTGRHAFFAPRIFRVTRTYQNARKLLFSDLVNTYTSYGHDNREVLGARFVFFFKIPNRWNFISDVKCQGCVTLHVFDKSPAIRTKNLFFVSNFALNLGIFSILNVFARSDEIPLYVT